MKATEDSPGLNSFVSLMVIKSPAKSNTAKPLQSTSRRRHNLICSCKWTNRKFYLIIFLCILFLHIRICIYVYTFKVINQEWEYSFDTQARRTRLVPNTDTTCNICKKASRLGKSSRRIWGKTNKWKSSQRWKL